MTAPADLRGLRLELFKEPRQEQLESDIVALLQRSYEAEFGEPARDLLSAALSLMPSVVPLDRQEALAEQIAALTSGMVLRQANLDTLAAIAEESYTRERVRTGLSLGLRGGAPELVFDVVDEAAVAWLGEETPFWVGEHYDTGLSETIRRVVLEVGLVDGLGVEEVGRRMEDVLGQTYGRSSSYYRLLATNGITRARNFGFVGTAQRAGMVEAEVLAVMDGHTSSICRALHGTVYRVSTLAAQRDAVIGSTPEEAKEIAAWRRADEVEGLDAEALAALGVAIPPYHGNCRTILVVR